MLAFFRCFITICHKDLLSDLRQRNIVNTLFFFGVLIIFLFSLAFGAKPELLKQLAPGLLWLAVLFSAVLALERSFGTELEEGCLDHLMLYSVSPRALFLGKWLANLIFILLVQSVVVALMFILFDLSYPKNLSAFIATLVLGDVGTATLGTFYAALISKIKTRQAMLPLLLFPMLIPLLLAAVYATQHALEGDLLGDSRLWLQLLCVFDTLFLAACLIAIEPLIKV